MLSDKGKETVAQVATRHGVSADAAEVLLYALRHGHGQQAQFNHPDLGGMGQWSSGGMIMVGDMFNNGLKARVDALARALAPLATSPAVVDPASDRPSLFMPDAHETRWPAELGSPSSTGSQNDVHYAVFPQARRLAILAAGKLSLYDTAEHNIRGFSQAQGGGASLSFSSQSGPLRLEDLKQVSPGPIEDQAVDVRSEPKLEPATDPAAPAPGTGPSVTEAVAVSPPSAALGSTDDILRTIEQLHALQDKGILSAEEYQQKKAELLARI